MKTETNNKNPTATTIVWEAEAVALETLACTEAFPEIGHQVTSILTTLNTTNQANTIKDDKTNKIKHEALYIMCELCPFMCLSEIKIKEHVDLVHKTKKQSQVFEMLCPACPNIFYHKLSLQAHLTYDHCVTDNTEIAKIIQIALHTKKPALYESKSIHLAATRESINIGNTQSIIETIEEPTHTLLPEENFSDLSNQEITDNDGKYDEDEDDEDDEEKSENKMMQDEKKKSSAITKFLDEKKLNKCPVTNCKVKMQQAEKLNYHMLCHSETIFKCLECGEAFSTWKSLTGHLWRLHNLDMELYSCDQCNYRTHSLSKLNNTHKLIHSDVKNFACDVCSKMFKNVKQLRNHKDTHKKANKPSCVCKECDKTFSSRHQLKVHKDGIHKKLKPFLCNFCGYKGATRGGLRMHIRQHTGEKPFKCELCPYSTADHNSLRRHKLRHSGEKPYKCSHCDYQSIQSSTYKLHIKTKHPGLDKELLFSCPACQFRSISKDLYNSHIASQHPEIKV